MAAATKANGSALNASFKHTPSTESKRSPRCLCVSQSVVLESVVIVLVIISALAITGDNLMIRFDLLTVPKHTSSLNSGETGALADGESTSSSTSSSTSTTPFATTQATDPTGSYNVSLPVDAATSPSLDSSNSSSVNGSTVLSTESTAGGGVPKMTAMTDTDDEESFYVDTEILDILENVFHYTSLGIAAFFFVEIVLKLLISFHGLFPNKWQVFDAVVVILTLGAELAFHYVDLPYKGLYSIKYIVVLRLWRIPYVCDMRAHLLREWLEQDFDELREGQHKAEEKCSKLELTNSQQAEIIRQLESALQTFSTDRDYERAVAVSRSSQGLYRDNVDTHVETKVRRSLLLRSKHNETVDMDETDFCHPGEPARQDSVKHIHDAIQSETNSTDSPDKDISPEKSKENTECGQDSLVESQQQKAPTDQQRKRNRRKTRRSSTSEYIDYTKLIANAERDSGLGFFKQDLSENKNRNSEPTPISGERGLHDSKSCDLSTDTNVVGMPARSHSNSSASDAGSSLGEVGKNGLLHDTSFSGVSEGSTLGDGEKDDCGQSKRGKSVRRYPSCPEYAYTQRLTITSDESALIIDSPGTNDFPIDNPGFSHTEEECLHVLAEFDGTKTYRSEDGIPMTSL